MGSSQSLHVIVLVRVAAEFPRLKAEFFTPIRLVQCIVRAGKAVQLIAEAWQIHARIPCVVLFFPIYHDLFPAKTATIKFACSDRTAKAKAKRGGHKKVAENVRVFYPITFMLLCTYI